MSSNNKNTKYCTLLRVARGTTIASLFGYITVKLYKYFMQPASYIIPENEYSLIQVPQQQQQQETSNHVIMYEKKISTDDVSKTISFKVYYKPKAELFKKDFVPSIPIQATTAVNILLSQYECAAPEIDSFHIVAQDNGCSIVLTRTLTTRERVMNPAQHKHNKWTRYHVIEYALVICAASFLIFTRRKAVH